MFRTLCIWNKNQFVGSNFQAKLSPYLTKLGTKWGVNLRWPNVSCSTQTQKPSKWRGQTHKDLVLALLGLPLLLVVISYTLCIIFYFPLRSSHFLSKWPWIGDHFISIFTLGPLYTLEIESLDHWNTKFVIVGKGLGKCKFTLHKAWKFKRWRKWRRMKFWHGIFKCQLMENVSWSTRWGPPIWDWSDLIITLKNFHWLKFILTFC
jgi:hypothetical protein